MTKKAKTKNPSILSYEWAKSRSWQEAIEQRAFLYNPSKTEWRQQVIYKMHEYFDNPEHLIFEEFLSAFKIPFSSFDEWVQKYEDIAKAKSDVMNMIAVRRKQVVYKTSPIVMMRDLHEYDKNWHKVNKYHADLKNSEEAGKGGIVYVHAHQLPTKKEENE